MAHRLRLLGMLGMALFVALPAMSQGMKGRIAFQRDGLHNEPSNVVVMNLDGSLMGELPQHTALPAQRVTPSLSPDGRLLVFAANVGTQFKLFTWELSDQNTVVGEPKCITAGSKTTDKFPVWSPDGAKIAYLATDDAKKTTLRIIDADGSNPKVLTETQFFAAPSWRPDGQGILYIDVAKGKPVLKNALTAGGYAIAIREQSAIIAAAYSPDGTRIAAMVRNQHGQSSLCILQPFGAVIEIVTEKIDGVKAVCWPTADTVIFNAQKVGAQSGKAFWIVNPATKAMTGVTGYAVPKQISYFSTLLGVGGMPGVAEGIGPDGLGKGPRERVPTGPVTIMRPLADTSVHGVVPIKIIAQKDVRAIVLSIDNKFVYTAAPQDDDDTTPSLTFAWDTQQFIDFDPTRGGLPAKYADFLRYPDKEYVIRAQALSQNNTPLGADQIKVKVQNALQDTELPSGTILKFRFVEGKSPDERFDLKGEGILFGANASLAPNMAANLYATIRRSIIEVRPTGSTTMRSYVLPKSDEAPLSFALNESTIPETDTSALFTLSANGDIDILTQQLEKIYLPISLLSTPFPLTPVQAGTQWTGRMWMVGDLLERQATSVRVNDVLEGVEWIGARKAVRIRTDYSLDRQVPELKLATTPITTLPGLRGAETTAPAQPVNTPKAGMRGTAATPPPASTGTRISVQEANGVRYTWFDYEKRQLLRVEDFILYKFPLSELTTPAEAPAPVVANQSTRPAGGNPWGGGTKNPQPPAAKPAAKSDLGNAWYLTRYSYTLMPEDEDE